MAWVSVVMPFSWKQASGRLRWASACHHRQMGPLPGKAGLSLMHCVRGARTERAPTKHAQETIRPNKEPSKQHQPCQTKKAAKVLCSVGQMGPSDLGYHH
jgi:hypothetical protein